MPMTREQKQQISAKMKSGAHARECPDCGRKNALVRDLKATQLGAVRCRWCRWATGKPLAAERRVLFHPRVRDAFRCGSDVRLVYRVTRTHLSYFRMVAPTYIGSVPLVPNVNDPRSWRANIWQIRVETWRAWALNATYIDSWAPDPDTLAAIALRATTETEAD